MYFIGTNHIFNYFLVSCKYFSVVFTLLIPNKTYYYYIFAHRQIII